MSQGQQRLVDYLQHIVKAIARIQRYIDDCDENNFLTNELVQDAVIRNLEVVGEASKNINKHFPAFVREHPNVPFLIAYEMRNALAHGYSRLIMK